MTIQRWLALAVVGTIVAIIATRPLWTQPPEDEVTESAASSGELTPTPAPFVTSTPGIAAATGAQTSLQATATMEEAMMEEMSEMAEETPQASAPFILARGDFVQIDAMHEGVGSATIYQAPDGTRFVRLEPFRVTDAPDLRVLLAGHPAPRTPADLASQGGQVDLGPLQSIQDAQNYDIPANLRLEQVESVVIYSREFGVIVTTATLERQQATSE